MEWALKTSPEELINTFLNRTSPSEVGNEGSGIVNYEGSCVTERCN